MDEKMNRLLGAREDMYHFLSRLYMFEVDAAFFERLCAMEFPKSCANEDMEKGYQKLGEWLKAHEGTAADLDALAVDYARVFLSAGVAAGKAAFPYESVYGGTKHLVMQEAASQMAALYAKKGMAMDENMFKVPADHIGLEFEYMARLCREAADAAAGAQSTAGVQNFGAGPENSAGLKENSAGSWQPQADFFRQHLNNWVPVFCGEVIEYSETDFYKGLGWLTRGFMALEAQFFAACAGAQ